MPSPHSERTSRLPPVAHNTYPIDVYLRISPDSQTGKFKLDMVASGYQPLQAPIHMSPGDLEKLNERCQGAMEAAAESVTASAGVKRRKTPAELLELAGVGYFAYKQVFSDPQARAFLDQLLVGGKRLQFQVISEQFFVPWELMYSCSPKGRVAHERFWGMNHVIARLPPTGSWPCIPPVIETGKIPRVGLLVCESMPAVARKEIPFFERLHKDGSIQLFRLRALDPSPEQREKGLEEFASFLTRAFHVAHFACHAVYERSSPPASHVMLSNDFPVSLEEMETNDVSIAGHPLVILNACETGNLNPLYTASFASKFLQCGARGVIATESAIPDSFAANLAQKLYRRLLSGAPLGDSLLEVRRSFLRDGNPLGLFYGMYAPSPICLKPKRG